MWVATVICVVVLYIAYKLKSIAGYWKERGIAEVSKVKQMKNTYNSLIGKVSFEDIIKDMYEEMKDEKVIGLFQFTTPQLILVDPEIINRVLIKDFAYFVDRGFPMDKQLDPLSDNLVGQSGDHWRINRYKLTPTFTSGKLKIMFDQVVEITDETLNFIGNGNSEIECRDLIQKHNLNVIGSVAFGIKVDTLKGDEEISKMLLSASNRLNKPSPKQLVRFLVRTCFPKLGAFLGVRIFDKEISDFIINLVGDTIRVREGTQTRRNDFLQMMMDLRDQEKSKSHSGSAKSTPVEYEHEDSELLNHLKDISNDKWNDVKFFTDSTIAAQSFLFLAAGTDTTAGVLSFVLYELACHSAVQERTRQEITDVLGSSSENPRIDYEAVKKMVYLDQVINEVTRLHTAGGGLFRICVEDYKLPGTNAVIEKGTSIIIPTSALHRDSRYYPDPETFNPDRFQDMKAIPKGVFLPFGDGPRMCIAKRLALMQVKIFIVKVLSKYNISLGKKTQLPVKIETSSFSLHVVGGMWINFERRASD